MRKSALLTLACIGLASCAPVSESATSGGITAAAVAEDASYIVVFRDGVRDVPGLARGLVTAAGGQLEHTYQHALPGFAARLPAEALEGIRQHPDVRLVERDLPVTMLGTQASAPWNLDRVDQVDLPLDGGFSYGTTGSGVTVYVLDTGIRATHTEFEGRAAGVYTVIQDGNGTSDCNGHGTHVAGIIGGATWGVAKQVTLRAVRVLDCTGNGMVSGIVAGIDWVTANAVKPAAANVSIGSAISASFDLAVQNSIASGITYAVAAGNSATDACTMSPARVPEALTVAATTSSDARPSWSNFGTCVDLFAPGAGVVPALNTGDTDTGSKSGTSMAAPHVAGAAALYLQAHPTSSPAGVASAIIAAATLAHVTDAGTGSPNRLLFVTTTAPAGSPPVASFSASCSGLTCALDAGASTDDGVVSQYSWNMPDGTPASGSGKTISVTYPGSGTRNITLTVTDDVGLTGSVTRSITVTAPATNNPPVAAFSWSCPSKSCTFDGTPSTDDGQIVSYVWDLGTRPRTSASGAIVTTSYAKSGRKTVTLTVTDNGGKSTSVSQTVMVP